MTAVLASHVDRLAGLEPIAVSGTVRAVRGLRVAVTALPVPVGTRVRVERGARRGGGVPGEVVGFDDGDAIVMLYDSATGIAPDQIVRAGQSARVVGVGPSLLGRILDGHGRPLDDRPAPIDLVPRPLQPRPLSPLVRRRIAEPLPTGIRAIDAMLTLGRGQRIGVFSGPGVGKSTLLATIARNTAADVNVIALIGERGREVRDFIERTLGREGLSRSVVVVATGDESPLLRVRAALLATTIAEAFRDEGADVMLMMDSITRFAQAQRQIGLTAGEQPATKGYTPSVFAQLPVLLERAGAVEGGGTITGLYAVLVEGDDLTEPISDAARGVLDGHVALSRRLAGRGHFPAIDVLESISRVAEDVCDEHHAAARRRLRRLLSAYAEAEELIQIGAYARGSSVDCDVAIAMKDELDAFLRQASGEGAEYPHTCRRLIELAGRAEALARQAAAESAGARS